MSNEHQQWRKFLQPLVGALALLIAAATAAIQKGNNNDVDTRLTTLEVRTDDLSQIRKDLQNVRSDVSYIRGILENK